MIVFSEIKRCQHPHFTQIFQKAKMSREAVEVVKVRPIGASNGSAEARGRASRLIDSVDVGGPTPTPRVPESVLRILAQFALVQRQLIMEMQFSFHSSWCKALR